MGKSCCSSHAQQQTGELLLHVLPWIMVGSKGGTFYFWEGMKDKEKKKVPLRERLEARLWIRGMELDLLFPPTLSDHFRSELDAIHDSRVLSESKRYIKGHHY